MDQPSIDGLNTWLVARAAAQAGLKVAISGLGGDEFFGGYPSFRQVPILRRYARPFAGVPGLGRILRRLSAPVLGKLTSQKYAGLLEYGADLGGRLPVAPRCPHALGVGIRIDGRRDSSARVLSSTTLYAPRDRPGDRVVARGDAIHAQSAAAGFGLGRHGPLDRDPRAAGRPRAAPIRCKPASSWASADEAGSRGHRIACACRTNCSTEQRPASPCPCAIGCVGPVRQPELNVACATGRRRLARRSCRSEQPGSKGALRRDLERRLQSVSGLSPVRGHARPGQAVEARELWPVRHGDERNRLSEYLLPKQFHRSRPSGQRRGRGALPGPLHRGRSTAGRYVRPDESRCDRPAMVADVLRDRAIRARDVDYVSARVAL